MITGHLGLGLDPIKWIGPGKGSHMEKIHNVFHVSMLRRYSYPSHVLSSEVIELISNLTYEEEHVEILA